jgi:hypothetical protein
VLSRLQIFGIGYLRYLGRKPHLPAARRHKQHSHRCFAREEVLWFLPCRRRCASCCDDWFGLEPQYASLHVLSSMADLVSRQPAGQELRFGKLVSSSNEWAGPEVTVLSSGPLLWSISYVRTSVFCHLRSPPAVTAQEQGLVVGSPLRAACSLRCLEACSSGAALIYRA